MLRVKLWLIGELKLLFIVVIVVVVVVLTLLRRKKGVNTDLRVAAYLKEHLSKLLTSVAQDNPKSSKLEDIILLAKELVLLY